MSATMTTSSAPARPYAQSADEVASQLGVEPDSGLSAATAAELLGRDGPNALPAEAGVPGWRRFLAQYKAYMQIILLIAAILSFAIAEWSTGTVFAINIQFTGAGRTETISIAGNPTALDAAQEMDDPDEGARR